MMIPHSHVLLLWEMRFTCSEEKNEDRDAEDRFYSLNLTTKNWTQIQTQSKPSPRMYQTLVNINRDLFVFGGYDDDDLCSDHWRYSIEENKWFEIKHQDFDIER